MRVGWRCTSARVLSEREMSAGGVETSERELMESDARRVYMAVMNCIRCWLQVLVEDIKRASGVICVRLRVLIWGCGSSGGWIWRWSCSSQSEPKLRGRKRPPSGPRLQTLFESPSKVCLCSLFSSSSLLQTQDHQLKSSSLPNGSCSRLPGAGDSDASVEIESSLLKPSLRG